MVVLHGTGIEAIVEDVAAIETHAPLTIVRRPLQFGIHVEDWTDVVDALYSLRLEEWVKNKAQVLRTTEFYGCRTAKYDREFLTIEWQVEETVAFVVLEGAYSKHIAVEPFPCIEYSRDCSL